MRLSARPFAPLRPLDVLTYQLWPKLQERRAQAIHSRPGSDADPDIVFQSGFQWSVDTDSPFHESLNEILARHNGDPGRDSRNENLRRKR